MRKFLYYILKEDGRSGKVVNGVVTYSGTPSPLPQTPDGWQSLQIAWERSASDHGIIRNYSLPFGFVRDGMKIIRDALYNQSIEEKIFLLIQTLTLVLVPNISYNWLYNYLYKGELDLSAAEDHVDMINVPCMEGGLAKLLKANRNTKYTYDFDDKAVNVNLDGILLLENANYIVAGTINNEVFAAAHTIPISFVNKEGTNVGFAFFTQNLEDVTPNQVTYVASSTNYYIINNSGHSQNFNIKGKIKVMTTKNTASLSYRWLFVKNTNVEINVYNSTDHGAISVGTVYEVDVDINFTLANGEKLFFIERFFGSNPSAITIENSFLDGSYLNVTFESTADASNIKAYQKPDLFKKLVGSVCGDESFASSALCETWKHIVVTSGDAIRGLINPKITTSLNDFFEDMNATFMAGMGINSDNKLEIESREKYYDNSDPVNLGNIKDVVVTPATDYISNKFKPGHPKPDIEDINGKYDPNGSDEFSGHYTKIVNDYQMNSPYKAGPFEIESLRLNLDGKVTTDDNRDNDVYVINCEPADSIQSILLSFVSSGNYIVFSNSNPVKIGTKFIITGTVSNNGTYNVTNVVRGLTTQTVYTDVTISVAEFTVNCTIEYIGGQVYNLNRPTYTVLEGMTNNTVFNIENLTPKRMLLAHGRWIKSMHYGLHDKLIKFNSGDKNTELITELNGVTIDENADVQISSLGEIMFLPFIATFATEVPVDIVDILEANPNRCFKGYDEIRGVWVEGFLLSAGFAPNDLKEQEFRLLLSPNNDLTLLP